MKLETNKGIFDCTVISASQSRTAISVVLPVTGNLSKAVEDFEGTTFLEWEENGETIRIDGAFSPTKVIRTDTLDSIGLEGVIT